MEYIYRSPLGKLLLVFQGETLVGLRKVEETCPGDSQPGNEALPVMEWLDRYFAGLNPSPERLDYKARGSGFQEGVWKSLMTIPYGYCATYGFLARMLAPQTRKSRLMARAVGQALARNPIWIVIPCHRIVKSTGESGSYAGGLEMKKELLKLEGAEIPALWR